MEVLTGTIRKLYNNCPKPDHWTGFHFDADDGRRLKMTGRTCVNLEPGMKVKIRADHAVQNSVPLTDTYEFLTISTHCPDKESFIKFVTQFDGIGTATAEKVWKAFEDRSIDMIEEDPKLVAKKAQIPMSKAEALHKAVAENNEEAQLIRSFPMFAEKLKKIPDMVDEFGKGNLMQVATQTPYELTRVAGVSFAFADKVALYGGMQPEAPERLKAGYYETLKIWLEDRADCYLAWWDHMRADYQYDVYKLFLHTEKPVSVEALKAIVPDLKKSKIFWVNDEYKERIYADAKIEKAERETAYYVLTHSEQKPVLQTEKLDRYIQKYEKRTGISLDEEQKLAVKRGLENRLSVITGGPGHGKTTILECLVYVWQKISEGKNVHLAAPTGAAKKRLEEAVNEHAVLKKPLSGSTLARIRYQWLDLKEEQKDLRAMKDAYKDALLVIDEFSMVDLEQFYDIEDLLENTQVVFVGDVDQLPSIGAGQLLQDFIDCGKMPVTTLTHIYRTAHPGLICITDEIREGCAMTEEKLEDIDYHPFHTAREAQMLAIEKYQKALDDGTPIDELCLIATMHKGDCGIDTLNQILQGMYNPKVKRDHPDEPFQNGMEFGLGYFAKDGTRINFRMGDRIIWTKNEKAIPWKSLSEHTIGCGIYNGDKGTISDVQKGAKYTITLDDGRIFETDYDTASDEMELGYAMTVHKAQGSEYKHVIIVLDDYLGYMGPEKNFATKNLLYTAVTRAKETCTLIGNLTAINTCIKNPAAYRNCTLLDRITKEI